MRKSGIIGNKKTATSTTDASGAFEIFELQTLASTGKWPTYASTSGYTLSSDTGSGYYANGVYPGTNFKFTISLTGVNSSLVNSDWYLYTQLRETYYYDGKSSSGTTVSFWGTAGTAGDWSGNDIDITYNRVYLNSGTTITSGYFRALSMVGEYYNGAPYNGNYGNNYTKSIYVDFYLVQGASGTPSAGNSIKLGTFTFYRQPCYLSVVHNVSTIEEGLPFTTQLSYLFSSTAYGYGGTLGTKTYYLGISSSSTATAADLPSTFASAGYSVTPGSTTTISTTPISDGVTEGSESLYVTVNTYNNASTLVNIGGTSIRGITITDPPPPPSFITSGNKAPTLGAGGATWVPSGYTELVASTNFDDASVTVPLGFTFYMAGTAYTSTYMGSNTYITFGAGSSAYSALGPTNPANPKFLFGASDNSYQRVAYKQSAGNWCKIRYEGNGTTSGTAGSPGITLEITLYNPAFLGTTYYVCEVLIGNHNRQGAVFGAYSASAAYVTPTYAPNTSMVFVSTDTTGSGWKAWNNYYVTTAT